MRIVFVCLNSSFMGLCHCFPNTGNLFSFVGLMYPGIFTVSLVCTYSFFCDFINCSCVTICWYYYLEYFGLYQFCTHSLSFLYNTLCLLRTVMKICVLIIYELVYYILYFYLSVLINVVVVTYFLKRCSYCPKLPYGPLYSFICMNN